MDGYCIWYCSTEQNVRDVIEETSQDKRIVYAGPIITGLPEHVVIASESNTIEKGDVVICHDNTCKFAYQSNLTCHVFYRCEPGKSIGLYSQYLKDRDAGIWTPISSKCYL